MGQVSVHHVLRDRKLTHQGKHGSAERGQHTFRPVCMKADTFFGMKPLTQTILIGKQEMILRRRSEKSIRDKKSGSPVIARGLSETVNLLSFCRDANVNHE